MNASPALPFVARPRLWTWRLAPEVGFCLFIASYVFGTGGVISWSYYVVLAILVVLALGWPVWLCSRTLTIRPDGVTFRPFFGVSVSIPYSQAREVWVDRRVLGTASGGSIIEYGLRIIGTDGRRIKVAMDAYHTADLQIVAQEINVHAEHVRLKGLAPQLVDGSEAFLRYYRSQR